MFNMKKLVALFLTMMVLFAAVPTAMAGDEVRSEEELTIVDINWMAEEIAKVVGYKPYYLEMDYGDGEVEWLFIMAGGSLRWYSVGQEDTDEFMSKVACNGFEWYSALTEDVTISGEERIQVGDGFVYLDSFFYEPGTNLVLGYNGFNTWLNSEEFEEQDGVYTFSKKHLAQLVYEDEMSHLQYVGELLDEIR